MIAIAKIKSYLRKRASHQMNIKMLTIHSISFSLFIVSNVYFTVEEVI